LQQRDDIYKRDAAVVSGLRVRAVQWEIFPRGKSLPLRATARSGRSLGFYERFERVIQVRTVLLISLTGTGTKVHCHPHRYHGADCTRGSRFFHPRPGALSTGWCVWAN